jgi:hypothetical protein
MIENLVDSAVATMLSTIPGLVVVVGMQDNDPALVTPYCAVYSNVQNVEAKTPIFELLTTIEYVSISGQDTVTDVESVMTSIDSAMLTPPVTLKVWPLRTQQDVGDRRRNIREYKVFASLG